MSNGWDGPHNRHYVTTARESQPFYKIKDKFEKFINEFNTAKSVNKADCLMAVLEAKKNFHDCVLKLDLPNEKDNQYHKDESKLTKAALELIVSEDATSVKKTIPECIEYPYNLSKIICHC